MGQPPHFSPTSHTHLSFLMSPSFRHCDGIIIFLVALFYSCSVLSMKWPVSVSGPFSPPSSSGEICKWVLTSMPCSIVLTLITRSLFVPHLIQLCSLPKWNAIYDNRMLINFLFTCYLCLLHAVVLDTTRSSSAGATLLGPPLHQGKSLRHLWGEYLGVSKMRVCLPFIILI